MSRRQKIHAAAFMGVMLTLLGGGWVLASQISQSPVAAVAATVTQPAQTIVHTHTRVVKKIVRGKVVTLKGGTRVVRVPLVVLRVHNERCHPSPHHRCVRVVVVPAHTIPLRAAPIRAAVAVAAPLIPITVYVPITVTDLVPITVTDIPPPVTSTETQTATETQFLTVTETVSGGPSS